ncbi:MAG: adenylosuccinate synthase [SAR202 cluster bacterium]|nr:adenylosuccinate synthase [SAR202 cluster bacterium]
MPAYGLIGGQWGDEGKGKVVDYLANQTHWVVRYSGGNNAGHTVINEKGSFSLHLVPSGVFRPNVSCVIGNGVVVDPDVLLHELAQLEDRGVDTSRVYVSDRAHLIMPYHILIDGLEEASRGKSAIGTTKKGVGPAYVDKAARTGIRAGELLDLKALIPRLKTVVEAKNAVLTKLYDAPPISLAELSNKCVSWADQLKDLLRPTELVLQEALVKKENILLEGAQGALLDMDHGTYPYVTSSSSSIGGALTGLGFGPSHIKGVIGVFKAYCTRVGGGPFPSEMTDNTAHILRERAWEYGTTTGRARRIGWFDAIAARYSNNINGLTSLVLTRLDVLDGFNPVKICVGYKVDGQTLDHFPASVDLLARCQPVYDEMSGWDKPTAGATDIAQLPEQALNYVRRLEKLIGTPFHMISTGPHRNETIPLKPLI